MFKRVEGGFIFRAPGLFPRHYVVTEVQKVVCPLKSGPP
jgi:hypothetical protein